MRHLLIFISLLLSSFTSAHADGSESFISDSEYRAKVEKSFNEKIQLIGSQFFSLDGLDANRAEEEALKFLYAYMPLADATDYSTSFYLANIRASFQAQQEMAWGSDVPELLFRHFVLPIRVNNENLDLSRIVFFKELKERVKGLSMQDAILEVNHWCHERVTYQPSDGRTLSPLACVRNAIGRCGEESTFTVAALRSIGIPARQVYTPRWAHTDDNHAWVEAWADGQWFFLGACEPEPVLNLGWFNAPASRALLMHTRAFGDYDGPEEVMLRTSNFTEINLIDNYSATAMVNIKVVDRKGKPASGARVDFKIYNYAEFYTAVTKYADNGGRTFLTAGKGDMVIWASKDGWYGWVKASFGKDKNITVRLVSNTQHPSSNTQRQTLDIVPPAENAILPAVGKEQAAHNKWRFAREDSIRKAYEATFLSEEEAQAYSPDGATYLAKSRSNWPTILTFLNRHADGRARALALLATLSDKDLRDMPLDILEDHYNADTDQLSPRVENEMIIAPFKQFLRQEWEKESLRKPALDPKHLQRDPSELVRWTKENIRLNPDGKSLRIAQTPVGVWRSRVTDTRSRTIFFVDLARSLGIEARKDVVTGKLQYRHQGEWVDVDFNSEEQKVADQGTLKLDYTPTKITDDPKYYSHFSIARILPDGTTALMNFEEGQVDMGGGTSWKNTFKDGTSLDIGTYLLTTGTRLANGSVLASTETFRIEKDKTTTLPLRLRQSDTEVSVIGNFDSESRFQLFTATGDRPEATTPVSILSQTGRGYFVVGLLAVGQEPTNHAMRDIAKAKAELDKWGRPFVLLFENQAEAEKYKRENFGSLPQNIVYGIDENGAIRSQIAAAMKLSGGGQMPIFILADTFNRVVFCSEGYTIGLGEQIAKTASKL